MIVERPYVTGGSAKQITSGGPVAVANLLASRFEDSRLFSFPRRWCPAITARGFSDSIGFEHGRWAFHLPKLHSPNPLRHLSFLLDMVISAFAHARARRVEEGEDMTTATATSQKTQDTIRMSDGTRMYYKDWGAGQPVVFSHGWPLSADAWEDQMVFLGSHGYRCIAHDRRGHGRSGQPWNGNDMDTYADDLATLVEALELKNAVHVGHSTFGGEVARYIGRHGTKRVAKAVLIGAVPPLMLKTAANPGGTPIETFDAMRAGVLADRAQFFRDLSIPFYGANRPGAKVSQGVRDVFFLQSMQAGFKAAVDCIKAFSETDFTEDLKRIDVPALILHGDDDQIVPIGASALLSAKLVKHSTLKVYPGFAHGMCTVNKDQINPDLLAFLKA